MTENYLACGVPFEEILDQVTDHAPPRDPGHQATCATCRATLAELSATWASVDGLVGQQVRAPAALLRAVMDRIRELSSHPWYAVLTTPEGDTKIAARVIGAVARLAAQDVPQVSLALGGGRTGTGHSRADLAGNTGETATDVGVSGQHVIVDVDVVVEMGAHIPQLADQIRARISHDIADLAGLTVAQVNISILDVAPSESAAPRADAHT